MLFEMIFKTNFYQIFLDDSVQHKLVYKRRSGWPLEKPAPKCRNGGIQFNETKSLNRRQHQSYLPGLHWQTSIHIQNLMSFFKRLKLFEMKNKGNFSQSTGDRVRHKGCRRCIASQSRLASFGPASIQKCS